MLTVEAHSFPGERLSVPGYLIRGVLYDLSSLSLGGGNVDRLIERGLVPKELLPPAPDVEPETLGLEDLLAGQAGGSRVGSTTRLKEGREEGGKTPSQKTPLNMQSQALEALKGPSFGRGVGSAGKRNPLERRETEDELVGRLEERALSGAQASTSVERGAAAGGGGAQSKVLDMAAALDAIKGAVQSGDAETGLRRSERPVRSGSESIAGISSVSRRPESITDASKEQEDRGGGTWLTAALNETSREEQKVVAAAKREVELDTAIRNKYEGKLKSIREKAATRKREGRALDARTFDISRATKVGWKGGAISVPGAGGGAKWRVLPGAGELLKHLKVSEELSQIVLYRLYSARLDHEALLAVFLI